MASVQLDDQIHREVKKFIDNDRIEYPSIQNFIERAVRDKLRIELINYEEQQ